MMIRFPNLGVELGYVGRSVRIFGFEITFGGMLLALGMLAGLAFIVLEAKRRNENQDAYVGMMITAVIFGLIGARLFYVGFSCRAGSEKTCRPDCLSDSGGSDAN